MTHLSRSVMTGTPLNGTKNVDLPRYDRGIGIGLLATAAGQNRPKRARIAGSCGARISRLGARIGGVSSPPCSPARGQHAGRVSAPHGQY